MTTTGITSASDRENNCPAHALYESRNSVTAIDGHIESLNDSVTDKDKQIAALHMRLRKSEVEGYKAQFRLSCQLRQSGQTILIKDQIIATKDREIVTLHNSRSMRLTKPLRAVLQLGRRVLRAIYLSGPAIKHGGGLWLTIRKAVWLYQMYGFEGIKRGFRTAATTEQHAVRAE